MLIVLYSSRNTITTRIFIGCCSKHKSHSQTRFPCYHLELSGLSLFSTPSPSQGYALCKISFNLFLENQTRKIILFLRLLAVYGLVYTCVSLFKSKPIYISISCIFKDFSNGFRYAHIGVTIPQSFQ